MWVSGERLATQNWHLNADCNAVHKTDTEDLGAAWEELGPELSRLVRALGIHAAHADDILQEVFLTAREKCPAALPSDDLRRWMIRVTVNRCRLEHRRTSRWRRAMAGLTHIFEQHRHNDVTRESIESLERDEGRKLVRQSLELLPAETRMLLVLRYFAELNSTEIGKILDIPEATVRGRLSAARHKLAEQLRKSGYRPNE